MRSPSSTSDMSGIEVEERRPSAVLSDFLEDDAASDAFEGEVMDEPNRLNSLRRLGGVIVLLFSSGVLPPPPPPPTSRAATEK